MRLWTAALTLAALTACQSTPPLMPDTPPKAYEKEVLRRMNAVWHRVAYERRDSLIPGTVKFQFKVLPDGRVSDVKMVSNSGNDALAAVARRTIEDTSIPPIPRATLAELPHGYMPGNCDFTTYYTP
jgi:TonB family protein